MINEAIINQEYYRRQLIEMAAIIRADSVIARKLRQRILAQEKLIDSCDSLVDQSTILVSSGLVTIEELNKENKKLHRKAKFISTLTIVTSTLAAVFAVLLFAT